MRKITSLKIIQKIYSLTKEVKFCTICTYGNQKPNSEQEYKHSIKMKKLIINFDEKNN
jgi:hypothetical protein